MKDLKKILLIIATSIGLCWALAGKGGGAAGGGSGFSGAHIPSENENYSGNTIDTENKEINWVAVILCISIPIGFTLIRFELNRAKSRKILKKAESQDAFWEHNKLKEMVAKSFIDIQNAWTQRNFEWLRTLLSDDLATQWEFQLVDMHMHGKRNLVSKCVVNDVDFIVIKDYKDVNKEEFIAEIDFSAKDADISYLGKKIHSIENGIEYWKFKRKENEILLIERLDASIISKIMISLESSKFEKM